MEIIQPVKSNIGFVGQQEGDVGGLMRCGGSQIQFDESISGKGRLGFLKPSSMPVPLN
jgi:hypothetical protein